MKPVHPREPQRPAPDAGGEQRAGETPRPERRASHRVSDDQQSGQGATSAWSKLKMLERKRAAVKPGHDEHP